MYIIDPLSDPPVSYRAFSDSVYIHIIDPIMYHRPLSISFNPVISNKRSSHSFLVQIPRDVRWPCPHPFGSSPMQASVSLGQPNLMILLDRFNCSPTPPPPGFTWSILKPKEIVSPCLCQSFLPYLGVYYTWTVSEWVIL